MRQSPLVQGQGTPDIAFSGRQSPNVEVGDSNFRPNRDDMEHISPGWSDFDFLHKRHGMNPTPVAEQALGAVTQPKVPTNLATLIDPASGNPQQPLMPGSSSAFSGAVPPNWQSVGPTRPGLQLAPWNIDWNTR
jgi:hypothetical protein